jgi:hypothetical protein
VRAIWVCVVLAAAAPAFADVTAATIAFDRAMELKAAGKWSEACPLFEASYREDRELGVLLHLAECHEQIGRTATAWGEFRQAEEEAQKKNDPRAKVAREHIDALLPRLVRIHVAPMKPAISGLVVKLDEANITALVDTDLPIDPGAHVLTASAPGYADATQALTIDPAKPLTTATLPTLAKQAAVAVTTTDPAMTPEAIAGALEARAREQLRERDERIARVRRHVRPFVGVGGGIAGGVGSPGFPPTPAVVVSVGARLGISGSLDLVATAHLWERTNNGNERSFMGTPQVTVTSDSWTAPAFDLTLRVHPTSPASGFYIGLGGGLAYVMAQGKANITTAGSGMQMDISANFVVPDVYVETGFVFGKDERWDLTIWRIVVGPGLGSNIPTQPGTCTMLVGFLRLGYTFL